MDSNVIAFPGLIEEEPRDVVLEFMHKITDWAEEQGVDITSQHYKYDAAVIMTSLQSMMLKVDK